MKKYIPPLSVCFFALTILQVNTALAQCRKQTPPEKAVISKAVKIFEDTFDKSVQNIGWQITEEDNGCTSSIAIHPAPFRPLFMCNNFFDLKLSLNPNSAYGKMMQDSVEYYNSLVVQYSQQYPMKAATQKALKQASENMSRVSSLQSAEITIDANNPALKDNRHISGKDKYTVLHIAGAAYACRIYIAPEDNNSGSPKVYTKLFFGNWNGADYNANTAAGYPFIHKQQGPFIENFVVTIKAPASAADKIIQNIVWNKLNGAISK